MMQKPPKAPETKTPELTATPTDTHVPALSKAPYDPDEEEELHCECSNPRHQHR